MDHFCSQYSGRIAVCRSACSDLFFISPVSLSSTGLDRLLFDRNASAVYLGRISMPYSMIAALLRLMRYSFAGLLFQYAGEKK